MLTSKKVKNMAKTKAKVSLRPRRIFSDVLKKKIVKDIEAGKVNVLGVSREYEVSENAVYMWLKKFSANLHPSTTIVMQMDSEQYRTKELEKKIAELEAAVGRKQLEIDFLNKLIEIADQDMGTDIKKNIVMHALAGTAKIKGKEGSV
jgi:transposase